MEAKFEIGDKVKWNFLYGKTQGVIIDIFNRTLSNNKTVIRYKVKSSKTGKTAVHKAEALTKI